MLLSSPELPYKPIRIISLVPSQTELLHHLCLENETIAITKFCIHPNEWFRNKTRIGGTKTIDIEKLTSLNPDLIIANKEENVKEQVELLAENFPIWVTEVNNLEDAYQMIADIGVLTKQKTAANKLANSIRNKFELFFQTSGTIELIPTVYLIWKDPFMTIGGDTFISNMMNIAGFKNVFESRERYPELSIDQIKQSGCKVLLLSSEPYPFKQNHIDELTDQLPGIKIILADGEMFSWYGSRLLKATDYFKDLMLTL